VLILPPERVRISTAAARTVPPPMDGGCGGRTCTRRHNDEESVAVGGDKRAARDRIGLAGIREELGWEVEELRVRPILAAEKWPKVSHLRFEIAAHMTERIT
jgi:hypothetical protein